MNFNHFWIYTCNQIDLTPVKNGSYSIYIAMKKTLLCFVTLLLSAFVFSTQIEAQKLKPVTKKASKPAAAKKFATAAPPSTDFVEPQKNGEINWTDQYIEAEGNSVIDNSRFKIPAQARLMAQRGAIADAQRNLLEIVSGVYVEGTTTVENLMVQSDNIKTTVKGLLKGARQVGSTQFTPEVATVKLRIPLYKSGLGDALVEEVKKDDAPVENVPVSADSTQLVLSVKGDYKPRLFPTLTDDQGNVLGDLAEAMDPTGGQAVKILKAGEKGLKALKSGNMTEILEVTQDALGNLKLSDKNKEKIEKWKTVGRTIWNIVKAIVLPI